MEQKYRMLEVGETLIEGDEFYLGGDRWSPTEEVGGKAESLQYRRPITENQCRYRDLTHDDTIQPGDEVWVFGSGPWEPVSASEHGQQYRNGYNRMRRPVAASTELDEVREAWQKDHMEMKRKLDAAMEGEARYENLWTEQCDHIRELKRELEAQTHAKSQWMKDFSSASQRTAKMEREFFAQRAELADAKNEITDLQKELQGKESLVKKLDYIEKTTMRLRGFREINSHDPARCIEEAASLITDLTRRLDYALSDKVIAEARIRDIRKILA